MAKRRVAVTILLVALVALAGCGGGTGTADDGPSDDDTPTPTSVEATPTPAGTATDAPTATPPPDSSGSAYSAAMSNHRSTVANQEGVVVTMNQQINQGGQNTTTQGTISVDPDTNERFAELTTGFSGQGYTIEQYSPPNSGRMQTCTIISGQCTSRSTVTDEDVDDVYVSPVTQTEALESSPGFEDHGLVSTDQGELRKYVADGTDTLAGNQTDVHFDTFRMTLFFDPDTGLVKKFVYEAAYTSSGVTTDVSMTVTYEYGPVDVQEPEWYTDE